MNLQNLCLQGERIALRSATKEDLPRPLGVDLRAEKDPEWKRWDGPYYPLESWSLDEYMELSFDFQIRPARGTQSAHRREGQNHTGNGFLTTGSTKGRSGLRSESCSIDRMFGAVDTGTMRFVCGWSFLFANLDIVRIGLSTWSGNHRMIRCAEKLGMQVEARIRETLASSRVVITIASRWARILREEWERSLERFAGTWDEDDGLEFSEELSKQRQIEKELWSRQK